MCFYHQDQICSESLMQSVCACYQDQYSSYFRLFRMKWSILILVVLMPCLQALCFMNVSFGQMIFLGVGHVIEFVLIFAQWQKIPQIPCSQICYWPIYVHILIFYWLIFRDICIVEYPLSIHQCVCSKKCSRYWSGAGVRLGRQNACAVIFDQNCCKVFIFWPLKKTGHLNPHSPHHLYFLPKLLWHVSKKSSNNINSINFAICDQKYITIILPSKESSGNYVIRKNEQGKLCGLRFFEKTIFPTFL